ncbi:MAG: hypothetical protein ABIJ37_03520 [Pseudomonadota bacterium]
MNANLKKIGILFILVLMVGSGSVTYAAEEGRLTLEERMIRLETMVEEGFKAVNQRIDTLQDSVKERFNYLYIMIGSLIALMGVMVSTVVWMARQDRPVAQKHYERIVRREDEMEVDIRSLKREMELLKARLA